MADIEAQIRGVTEHKPASTTATPQSPRPPVIAAAQPTTPTVTTNDRPHEDVPPSQMAGNPDPLRGEKYGDPSDGLWSMYLTEAEKQDKDVTESWKGDTEGILVFTAAISQS
ncbi:hypothetical protein EDB84DRAFT_1224236 [Lactarius hengduanensis]|nr:hypothetical protein EDB84DRAFT_1224236 [Lactarius hengduanensis]